MPPVKPMLAKAVHAVPDTEDLIFEPKWDGFRCVVFRDGDDLELTSRNTKSLTRYIPELADPLRAALPARCVIDGELVVVGGDHLDFEALQQRIHPAKSRVDRLAAETPCSYVAFDLLAEGDEDLTGRPFRERRRRLAELLAGAAAPVHLTPATEDRELAADWFARFEGAGLDGVMAKRGSGPYQQNKRSQLKIKHKRTADCVAAGYRTHKSGDGIGSLLIGLYDADGHLHHMGVATSFTASRRAELVDEVAPHEVDALDEHPWREWADAEAQAAADGGRMPGGQHRWNAQKDMSWTPLRIGPEDGLVVEVTYDNLQSGRFRHATHMVRWRPDKDPADCRFDQLEQTPAVELRQVFGA
jgi:ATP-dependent DNA ligase